MRALTNPTELESSWLLPILSPRVCAKFCPTTETPGYFGGASMPDDGEESRLGPRLDLQTHTGIFGSRSTALSTTLTGLHGCMSPENGRAGMLTISTAPQQTTDGQTCATFLTRQTRRTGAERIEERSLGFQWASPSTSGTEHFEPTSRLMGRRTALEGSAARSWLMPPTSRQNVGATRAARSERIADTAPKALRQEMREMAREG